MYQAQNKSMLWARCVYLSVCAQLFKGRLTAISDLIWSITAEYKIMFVPSRNLLPN